MKQLGAFEWGYWGQPETLRRAGFAGRRLPERSE